MTNRWKVLAIVLLILLVVEAAIIWKNWDTIYTAYKNRKIIGDAAAVTGGIAAISPLLGDLKSIF